MLDLTAGGSAPLALTSLRLCQWCLRLPVGPMVAVASPLQRTLSDHPLGCEDLLVPPGNFNWNWEALLYLMGTLNGCFVLRNLLHEIGTHWHIILTQQGLTSRILACQESGCKRQLPVSQAALIFTVDLPPAGGISMGSLLHAEGGDGCLWGLPLGQVGTVFVEAGQEHQPIQGDSDKRREAALARRCRCLLRSQSEHLVGCCEIQEAGLGEPWPDPAGGLFLRNECWQPVLPAPGG